MKQKKRNKDALPARAQAQSAFTFKPPYPQAPTLLKTLPPLSQRRKREIERAVTGRPAGDVRAGVPL